jgi:hypothetical protein
MFKINKGSPVYLRIKGSAQTVTKVLKRDVIFDKHDVVADPIGNLAPSFSLRIPTKGTWSLTTIPNVYGFDFNKSSFDHMYVESTFVTYLD